MQRWGSSRKRGMVVPTYAPLIDHVQRAAWMILLAAETEQSNQATECQRCCSALIGSASPEQTAREALAANACCHARAQGPPAGGQPGLPCARACRVFWQADKPDCYAHSRRVLRQAGNPDDSAWLPGARLNAADVALGGRDPDAPARAPLTRSSAFGAAAPTTLML